MQESQRVKSLYITFELGPKILNIVWELKTVEVSDDEDKTLEEEETPKLNGDVELGGQPTQSLISSKRSSPNNDLRRSR